MTLRSGAYRGGRSTMSQRARFARAAEVALLQIPVRLAKALLRVMADDPQAKLGQKVYRMRLLQRELGELIGVTRESVNKCLHSWQRDGVLLIEKGQITITDREALEELAEGA